MVINVKKINQVLIFFLLTLILVIPQISLAEPKGLIVCDGPDCDFSSLIKLIQLLIKTLIYIAIPLAALSFAWAGFTLITSGGSESAKTKAKSIFTKTLVGFVIVLAAWLIVYFISTALLDPNNSSLNLLQTS